MADDQTESLDVVAELLAEHSRLLQEKASYLEGGKVPPTAINFKLTKVVKQIVETAQADRDRGGAQSEELRSLLSAEADGGALAADDTLDFLADEDPWWRRPKGGG